MSGKKNAWWRKGFASKTPVLNTCGKRPCRICEGRVKHAKKHGIVQA